MELLNGIHHLTFITANLDRLIDFYTRIFEAQILFDFQEEGDRHAGIKVGPDILLHPFQIPGISPPDPQPMFQRGRLDHFALSTASQEAFLELRRRLMAENASDGVVTDMGSMWNLTFIDPDGGSHEIVWAKPGVPISQGTERINWTMVELD